MWKLINLAVLLLVCCHPLPAQNQSLKFPGEHKYGKAKIYFSNNNRIEASNLVITNDHVIYVNRNTRLKGEYDLKDVYLIKASNGTKVGEYALLGGAICGLSGALILLAAIPSSSSSSSSSSDDSESISVATWIGGWAAFGVLIGGIAGAFHQKWKTIYVNEHASILGRPTWFLSADPYQQAIKVQFTVPLKYGG